MWKIKVVAMVTLVTLCGADRSWANSCVDGLEANPKVDKIIECMKGISKDSDDNKRAIANILQTMEIVVYHSGLINQDIQTPVAKCNDPQTETLIGGSCINRLPNVPIGNNQVGIGPVFDQFGQPVKEIKCQRYTSDGSLLVDAFAICIRTKK